jgi:hypothetical protein
VSDKDEKTGLPLGYGRWEAYHYRENLWAIRDEGSKMLGSGLYSEDLARQIVKDHNTLRDNKRDLLLTRIERDTFRQVLQAVVAWYDSPAPENKTLRAQAVQKVVKQCRDALTFGRPAIARSPHEHLEELNALNFEGTSTKVDLVCPVEGVERTFTRTWRHSTRTSSAVREDVCTSCGATLENLG